jgi:hypothetical protein
LCFCEKAYAPAVNYKSGLSLKRQEKQIVVNVFNYKKAKNHDKSVTLLVTETATDADKK